MPTFQITGPDGKQYRVSGENAEGALSALQQHVGAPAPSITDAVTDIPREIGRTADTNLRAVTDNLSNRGGEHEPVGLSEYG